MRKYCLFFYANNKSRHGRGRKRTTKNTQIFQIFYLSLRYKYKKKNIIQGEEKSSLLVIIVNHKKIIFHIFLYQWTFVPFFTSGHTWKKPMSPPVVHFVVCVAAPPQIFWEFLHSMSSLTVQCLIY